MSSEPLVCCIMLTRDRPAMAKRAVECFRSQSYDAASRYLLILDTGDPAWYDTMEGSDCENEVHWLYPKDRRSIGALRNLANACSRSDSIIAHWDSDDWSHPNRLAEQVALLQASGAEAVGYSDMLFWDETPGQFCASWLYSNPISRYALGTSLCYWRKTWERVPFDDVPVGEDDRWCRKVRVHSVSSVECLIRLPHIAPGAMQKEDCEPRMIASIHGGNTSSKITPGHRQWKRVPEWDSYCHSHMRLEAK